MERLVILVGRPNKSLTETKYFFYVPRVGRFMPLVGVIRRPVESPLQATVEYFICRSAFHEDKICWSVTTVQSKDKQYW